MLNWECIRKLLLSFSTLPRKNPLSIIEKASESQRVLASWPSKPLGLKVPAGNKAERVTLIKIYTAIVGAQMKAQNKMDWNDLAHLGLLYRATGQFKNTEAIWSKALPTAEADTNSNGAAGLLLAAFFKQKRWTDFIQPDETL